MRFYKKIFFLACLFLFLPFCFATTFQSSAATESVYTTGAFSSDARIFLKFNISSIPAGATINNAQLQMYTVTNKDDNDYTVYYITNQSWTESNSTAQIWGLTTGVFESVTGCWTTVNSDGNCEITNVFTTAYNNSDTNFSIRIEDPDQNTAAANSSLVNNTNLYTGDSQGSVYKKFNTGPVLFVDYTLPAPNAPKQLQVDYNSSYALNSNNGAMRLTWTDNSSTEDGFRVYRGFDSNSRAFALLASLDANTSSYDDLGTGDNNSLFYVVSAYNSGGDANSSIDVNISVDRSEPSSPALSLNAGSNYVDLNWSTVDDNSSSLLDENSWAYWRLDETTGSFALDSANGDANLSLNNMENADWVTGKTGRGLEFDGSNEFANSNNFGSMDTNAFSVSLWANTKNSGTLTYFYLDAGGDSNETLRIHFASGTLPVALSFSNDYGVSINCVVSTSGWHHIGFTFDSTNRSTAFFDGASCGTDNSGNSAPAASTRVVLASSSPSGANYFQGTMDEIKVWNKALSSSDINSEFYKSRIRYDLYRGTGLAATIFYASVFDTNSYHDANFSDTNSPSAPSSLTATAIGSTEIDVNWSSVTDNGTTYSFKVNAVDFFGNDSNSSTQSSTITSGIAGFFVNCVSGGDCNSGVGSVDDYNSSVTGLHLSGLSANTQYCFTVLSVDGSDNNSSASSQVCVTTGSNSSSLVTSTRGISAVCGNRVCEEKLNESCNTCSFDCGVCKNVCGNKSCEEKESFETCSVDCPKVEEKPSRSCGDGVCSGTETSLTCSSDCAKPPEFKEPAKLTCVELKGNACTVDQYCLGEWVNAFDAPRCCAGTCYVDPDISVFASTLQRAVKGQNAQVLVTVLNKGGPVRKSFDVELLELSSRPSRFSGKKTVNRLEANDAVSFLFEIPFSDSANADLSGLSVSFRAIVDSKGELSESNKQNNDYLVDLFFAGNEICENGIDDDFDIEIDENCDDVTNVFISQVTTFTPRMSDRTLQSIDIEVTVGAEYADARNFYVNFYKDSLGTPPVGRIFVDLLRKNETRTFLFTYNYSQGDAVVFNLAHEAFAVHSGQASFAAIDERQEEAGQSGEIGQDGDNVPSGGDSGGSGEDGGGGNDVPTGGPLGGPSGGTQQEETPSSPIDTGPGDFFVDIQIEGSGTETNSQDNSAQVTPDFESHDLVISQIGSIPSVALVNGTIVFSGIILDTFSLGGSSQQEGQLSKSSDLPLVGHVFFIGESGQTGESGTGAGGPPNEPNLPGGGDIGGGSPSGGGPSGGQVCGNNSIEGQEVCDGTVLNGESCESQGFTGGFLVCLPNCLGFNSSNCTNFVPEGEPEGPQPPPVVQFSGTFEVGLFFGTQLLASEVFDLAFLSQEGASGFFSFEVDLQGLGVGQKTFTVVVDSLGQVPESNEQNNAASMSIEVIDPEVFNDLYFFDQLVQNEPVLIGLWEPVGLTDPVYSFSFDSLASSPVSLPLQDSIDLTHFSSTHVFKIFKLDPQPIVALIGPEGLPGAFMEIQRFTQENPAGELLGQITELEIIPDNVSDIFGQGNIAVETTFSSLPFSHRYYFERINTLTFLWWSQWSENQ